MSIVPIKATMMIPKNGKARWTSIMQNPPALPNGITENQYIVASYAKFEDGVSVFGGVAVGPKEQDYNYPLFMVFDKDYNQVGNWPIDTSDWEDFLITEISFSLSPDTDETHVLYIKEQE